MSKINIARAIQNIRANTNPYTPVVEMIVNAIQAIDESGTPFGKVSIRVIRSDQAELGGILREIIGFEVHDNGIGFTNDHRDSFDTLYTDRRISEGGKGFGRFVCLKYFSTVNVESAYQIGQRFKTRRFSMGRANEIIIGETIADTEQRSTGTIVKLRDLTKDGVYDKELRTVGRNLVERILPHFITKDYKCPEIVISEQDGSSQLRLNDFVNNEVSSFVREIPVPLDSFTLTAIDQENRFQVRVFKIFAPGKYRSRISLVAHRREVSGSVLRRYVPEFEDEFYEQGGDGVSDRNYIIKAYVIGPYLDDNVSLERGGFEFLMENDLNHGIGQAEIERHAADIARAAVNDEITSRQEKKRRRVLSYVDNEAPWHKTIAGSVDISTLSYNASAEEIETHLQTKKIVEEQAIKKDVEDLLSDASSMDGDRVNSIISKISDASKNDLVHYIATRREIIHIFKRSLQVGDSGKYSDEGVIHDIVFPRRRDSEGTPFHDHNLWMLDERLNFTSYISSDIALGGDRKDRPDLLVYNQRVAFRGGNETSNPIVVFEFKKPQRSDFVNQSARDDPVRQIVRYVNAIRSGKMKTPKGRDIRVADNTPFYGYIVCDLTTEITNWLELEQNFTPMPDRKGWFQWREKINLYLEVVSWDKILKDVQLRNRIFFEKLGI